MTYRRTPWFTSCLLFLWMAVRGYSQQPAVNEEVFLQAVAIVEQGSKPGKSGEQGIYQLGPQAVAQWGGSGKTAALRHLRWYTAQLMKRNLSIDPRQLALIWNAGLERACSGKAPLRAYDYAQRVGNIYDALLRAKSHE